MSFIRTFNNETLPIFNIRNYSPAVKLTSVVADSIKSTNVQSTNVQATAISQSNNSGTVDPMATELYTDGKVNALRTEILGGASNAYDSLKEIQTMMEADDTVMAGVLNTLSTKENKSRVDIIDGSLNLVTFKANVLESAINEDVSNLNSKISSDNAKFTIYDASFNSLQTNKLDSSVYNAKLSTVDSSINTINATLLDVDSELIQHDSRLATIDVSLNSLQTNKLDSNIYNSKMTLVDASFNTHNSRLNGLDLSCNSLQTSVNTLNTKTGAINVSGNTTTISNRIILTGGSSGTIQIGDNANDTLTCLASTANFANNSISQSAINGLATKLATYDTSFNSVQTSLTAHDVSLNSLSNELNSKASISYVDDAVSIIVGNAPSNMQTIDDVGSAIGYSNTFASDLNTRITAVESKNSTQDTDINNLKSKTSVMTYDSSNNILNLNSSLLVTKNEYNNGSIVLGDNINDGIHLNGQIVCSNLGVNITPTNLSRIFGLTSNVQTQLQNLSTNKLNTSTYDTKISQIDSSMNTFQTNILDLQVAKADVVYVQNQVSSAVASLVGSSPESLNTIQELATALQNTPEIITNLTTMIGTKANNSEVVKLVGNQDISGNINFTTAVKVRDQDIEQWLLTNEGNISTVSSNVNSLLAKTNGIGFDLISEKTTFENGILLNGSDLNTRITSIESKNTTQDASVNQLLFNTNVLTVSQNAIVDDLNTLSLDVSNNYVANTTLSTGYYNKSASDSKYATITNLNSVNSQFSSYLTNANASATFLTQSNASATYQTQSGMTSYFGLSSNNTASGSNTFSGANTFSGSNTFSNVQTIERMCESVHQAGSGGSLSLDYTAIKGIIIYAPSANYTLSLTNVPTSNTNCVRTLTLRYSTKFFANAININGSSVPMLAIGGASNLSVNSSAVFVYQTIHLVFNNSSTPAITTSIASIW